MSTCDGDKISALPAAGTLTGAEVFPVVQAGSTVQTPLGTSVERALIVTGPLAANAIPVVNTGGTKLVASDLVKVTGGTRSSAISFGMGFGAPPTGFNSLEEVLFARPYGFLTPRLLMWDPFLTQVVREVGPHPAHVNLCLWRPNDVAAGAWTAAGSINAGTYTSINPTNTSRSTAMKRGAYGTVVTTANQTVGQQTAEQQFMFNPGTADNTIGSFYARFRVTLEKYVAGDRLFIGFCQTTTPCATDPVNLTNCIGVGFDAADTALQVFHNDGAGTCTKTALSTDALSTGVGYEIALYSNPRFSPTNGSLIECSGINLNTGSNLGGPSEFSENNSTNVPAAGALMYCGAWMGNGANVVANDAQIGIGVISVETPY